MRRTASILLLPIMMIFAIQPVVAMHFCGGKLRSLNLFTQQTNTGIRPVNAVENEGRPSCCNSHESETTNQSNSEPRITGKGYCNIELLDLSTDDYQNNAEKQGARLFPFSIDNVGFILTRLFNLSDLDTNAFTPLQDFPPGGLFLKDVSLLTYICIYRI